MLLIPILPYACDNDHECPNDQHDDDVDDHDQDDLDQDGNDKS